MENPDDFDAEQLVRTLGEIGVGAAILGLRRLNIARRRLVEQNPDIAPFVDNLLDQVEAMAEPVSEALGELVTMIGEATAGPQGERIQQSGPLVAQMGPELLRLSGLTHRDDRD